MAQMISVSKAKQRLLELARRSHDLGESFILLKDGEPMSALLPFDEYESLLETLDILENEPDILSKLKRAEKEIKRGKCAVWKGAKAHTSKG
jgi:PHD/YefM family antitoxin component YafN of YafNO toxin-antitoxin module